MKFYYFSFLFLIFIINDLTAQDQNRTGKGKGKIEITLSGFIIDRDQQVPLEYATIAFFNKKDSSILGGTISDADGKFVCKVNKIPMYAKVDFIGYQSKIINKIIPERNSNNNNVDLGNIELLSNGLALNEVEIVGEKSETTFSLDKKVFTVGKDLANRGGTAEEILDNVPSVTVDVEGEVSLRGSTGVRILIDGRPSGYQNNTDALKQIPANLIKTIEVITNPSARYEAEGQAGIINITLKKEKRSGFNGSFDLTAGLPYNLSAGANLNYRKNKINWFANYNISDKRNMGGGFLYKEQNNPLSNILEIEDQNSDRQRNGFNNNIRFGFDYFIKESEILTGAFRYRNGSGDNINTVIIDYYAESYLPENLNANSTRIEDEREDDSDASYTLTYNKKFKNPKNELNVNLSYQNDLEEEYSYLDEIFKNYYLNTTKSIPQQVTIDEGSREWIFKIDYVKPLSGKDHQYELGARVSYRTISNQFSVDDLVNEQWLSLSEFTNEFDYDENIAAAYVQYGNRLKNKFNRFSYQFGLRAENAKVNTFLKTGNIESGNDYLRIFPSAFLNYDISETNKLQLSYSNRIRRPRFFELNPFITFADRRNRFEGNGNLVPEITDSYELNYLLFYDVATISAGLFYRSSTNTIQRLLAIQDSITIRQPLNIKSSKTSGLDLNVSFSGIKWYRLDANFNIFRFNTDGSNIFEMDSLGIYGRPENFEVSNVSWTGRLTNRFTFWKGSQLQIRANYRAANESLQGERGDVFSLDLGWTKDLLKEKNMTVTLSVRDVFNSRKRNSIVYNDLGFVRSEFQWRARTSDLTLSYRINQRKRFKRPQFGGSEGGF